jgi:hypothetical protein
VDLVNGGESSQRITPVVRTGVLDLMLWLVWWRYYTLRRAVFEEGVVGVWLTCSCVWMSIWMIPLGSNRFCGWAVETKIVKTGVQELKTDQSQQDHSYMYMRQMD